MKFKSDYQKAPTYLRIRNTTITEDAVLNLVFVLPVEASKEIYTFGNGFDECKKLITRNKISNNVVFIQPDYDRTPWYGNHVSNKEIRKLDHTIEVIKHIKTKYAYLNKTIKVFLLGFSKSGWGAMNILMHHTSLINGVLIWDAPLSAYGIEKWGMKEIFGNKDHFIKNHYLLRANGIKQEALKNKTIIIGGYDNFKDSSIKFLELLDKNEVEYIHDDTLSFPDKWNKDWIYHLLAHSNSLTK